MVRSSVAAFYSWLVGRFYRFTGSVGGDRLPVFFLPHRVGSKVEKIVHGMPEILFTSQIAFGGLDGCVPEQKLNLLQFTAAVVTQLRAGSSQIMRGDAL
jgi:hypothetical protein